MRRIRLAVLAVAAMILFAAQAPAAILEFQSLMDGLQETPPVASPGSGTASLFLDDATGDWTLNGTFADLDGTTTAAHIHGPAPPGTPAGIVVGLTIDLGVTSGSVSGAGTFTAAQMAELQDELYYVNIHTTSFSGGEIRGQLNLIPEPATLVLLGFGAAGFLVVAWRRRRRAEK